ncbi:MAG TPA: 50S ribosomal protein L6 [Kiritimatiellia bacterium]|jgi:large subunit ribosomal protein L6
MSRIGNRPIEFPKTVTVAVQGDRVTAKGPQGELAVRVAPGLTVKTTEGKLEVVAGDQPGIGAVHGTTRTLIANMIQGVQKHYQKDLEIQGVGFKAQSQGQKLVLALGYSHPIEFAVPAGITIKVHEGTAVTVTGADKHLVGQVSARIKSFFPAEPYKGKGVRFRGEHVRRKAGKAVA